MSARPAHFTEPQKTFRQPHKRMGAPTKAEKLLVAQFVADQPAALTPSQVSGLARTLRRSKDVTRGIIEEAKEMFVGAAPRYVDIHMRATEAALADGDNEHALKGSQWALSNIGADGAHIVEKAVEVASAKTHVLIGIKVGGIDAPMTSIRVDKPVDK